MKLNFRTLCACLVLVTYAGSVLAERTSSKKFDSNKQSINYKSKSSYSMTDDKFDQWIDAASAGNIEKIRSFIQEGVNVDETRPGKKTALWHAAVCFNPEVIKLLVDKGANVNYISKGTSIFSFVVNNACLYSKTDIVNLMLKHGANPNLGDSDVGSTPLMEVVQVNTEDDKSDNSSSISGSDNEVSDNESDDSYVSDDEILENICDVIDMLLEHGAELNQEDYFGKTALDYAVERKQNQKIVDLLIKRGAKNGSGKPQELEISNTESGNLVKGEPTEEIHSIEITKSIENEKPKELEINSAELGNLAKGEPMKAIRSIEITGSIENEKSLTDALSKLPNLEQIVLVDTGLSKNMDHIAYKTIDVKNLKRISLQEEGLTKIPDPLLFLNVEQITIGGEVYNTNKIQEYIRNEFKERIPQLAKICSVRFEIIDRYKKEYKKYKKKYEKYKAENNKEGKNLQEKVDRYEKKYKSEYETYKKYKKQSATIRQILRSIVLEKAQIVFEKLCSAIGSNDLKKVEQLVSNVANINRQDEKGNTALILAVEKGHKDIVKLLLRQEFIRVDLTNKEGQTALDVANKNLKEAQKTNSPQIGEFKDIVNALEKTVKKIV